jgi:hypothetical protein
MKQTTKAGPSSCGNCDAFLANKNVPFQMGKPLQGWCRAKPPQLMQVMVQVNSRLAPNGAQMAPGWQGVFPPTSSDVWCREWRPNFLAGVSPNPQTTELEANDATANEQPV